MQRAIAFGLNNFETMPASKRTRALTLKEISLKIRVLKHRHGYPPDNQEDSGPVEIEQAKRVCKDWA
ncbi:DUF3387 domain-containing protein [Corallococcus sp. Z5C101001]|uniref:DUF3387 domain-containing protein n=1 Tax=Corallococcus sp. Z5C101001 TaxID=2596829 RepID=UPI001180E42B|nr:DUF3387 domain-containing protein [Corallococcus sp. Z5C101001]TSC34447.1 DUF3387 domain-containing protein [Corallococcus sp. Z5C101001]